MTRFLAPPPYAPYRLVAARFALAVLLAGAALATGGCDAGDSSETLSDLAAPADVRASVDEPGDAPTVQLRWQSVSGASGYRVHRGRSDSPTREVATLDARTTAFEDDGVARGATYFYRITTIDADGDASRFSSAVAASVAAARCTGGTATHEGESFPCRNADLLAHLPIPQLGGAPVEAGRTATRLNEVWGWTDPQTDRQYALVGRSDGTAFVDVTAPADPVYLGSLPSAAGASSWRDIKVKDDHALVVSEARGHGMQVFDLARLRDVEREAVPVTFAPTAVYEGFGRAHNVVTAGAGTARAYGVGLSGEQDVPEGSTCGAGYHGVDLSTPSAPRFAGCFSSDLGGFVAPGYTHDAQCVTYDGPDTEHQGREICIGADESGLSVSDLTDLAAPQQLATATYPQTGYTHQGWLGPDQRYFYLDDELDEQQGVGNTRTLIWDLADLDAPILVTQHEGEATSIDHNQYLTGGFAYQANYTSGLRILDTANLRAPFEAGFFDVYPQNDGTVFDGAWGTYPFFGETPYGEAGPVLVNSISGGLFVVRPTGEAAGS